MSQSDDKASKFCVNAAQEIDHKKKVWELRTQGYTYEYISRTVGISGTAVAKILQRITKAYRERHLEDVERIKSEQVASLENVGMEAMQAWLKSKEIHKMYRQSNRISGIETVQEGRDQCGDPRFLQVFIKSKEDIRKIVGADAPIKSEVRYTELEKLSDEELRRRAIEALNEPAAQSVNGNDCADGKPEEYLDATAGSTEDGLL